MRNTTKEAKENPLAFLADAYVMGVSNSIEHQEKEGQSDLHKSNVLPVKTMDDNLQEILEKFGVRFLGVIKDDPLFQRVIFPQGWQIIPTEHSMWSYLVDEKGRKRASIFYKAAFYDRNAHICLEHRYGYKQDYDITDRIVFSATDGDIPIFTIERISDAGSNSREYYNFIDKVKDEIKLWLDNNYPRWQDASAYWD